MSAQRSSVSPDDWERNERLSLMLSGRRQTGAGHLIMTKKKIAREQAWWVDETIRDKTLPDETVPGPNKTIADIAKALPARVEFHAFMEWLGPVLGKYRDDIKMRAARPTLSEETATLGQILQSIRSARVVLRTMPPETAAKLAALSLPLDVKWPELQRRLLDDMETASLLMSKAEARLSRQKPVRGRKSAAPRNALLAAVVAMLRATPMKAADAREAAARIVGLCGVDTLTIDPESIRKANRRGEERALDTGAITALL